MQERRKRVWSATLLPWVAVVGMMGTIIWNRAVAETTSTATAVALEQLSDNFAEMRTELSRVATDVAVGKAERIADREAVAVATTRLTKALDELTAEMRKRRDEGR